MVSPADAPFMRRALELAKLGWGRTAPNPMVGAVLVAGGKIIAEGYHHFDGGDHAEIDCLRKVGFKAAGATLYVSLEPCSTKGRTGACTSAIIAAGIKRVVAGCKDPNPAHAGAAKKILASSGVECDFGVLEDECRELNFIFNKNIASSEALLAIKYAITKDGKIAQKRGEPSEVTSAQSRADVMRWRELFGATCVGFGTLAADNPSLAARVQGGAKCGRRIVFDASLACAKIADLSKYKLFSDEFASRTLLVCDSAAPAAAEADLRSRGASVMRVGFSHNSPEFWRELKSRLYEERVCSLFVEGGAGVFKSVCENRAADYVFEYVADKRWPGGLPAFGRKYFEINAVEKKLFGSDTFTRGYPQWIHQL